ncbi:HET-domain-containing protein [Xylariaceae sp. AK1471]|nr:HET-domain-containing protein [Xylariaceae sp. AK1471]
MPDLCDQCRSLDLQAALEELQARQQSDPDPTQPASQPKIEWYTNIKQIGASSSSSHCALCALVWQGWQESRAVTIEKNLRSADIVNPDNPPADFAKDILDIECYDKDATVSAEVLSRRNEVDDGRGLRGHVFLKITCSAAYVKSWEANFPLEAEFRVFRDGIEGHHEDEGLASDVDVVINPNPLSIGSFEIISAWLSNCTSKHGQACGRGDITDWPGLPSRVLDVQTSGENPEMIRLRRRDSVSIDDRRYVALSHRWGKTETPFCTTGDTINERMSGIRTSTMPRTFQDAVTVTRKLGLRYLWIDSLCIIQGDAADWAVEAADMSNIYRHCHLLIGAANSPSDNTGFLHSREQVDMVPLGKFQIQLLPPENSRWTDSTSIDPMVAEPLNERAWCLQERVLPTKRLFYGTAQMFWECQTLRASEGGDVVDHIGGINLRQLYPTGNSSVSVFLRYPAEEPESNEEDEEEENFANRWTDWYQVVEEYSTRQLTKDDDRLVALGGLARLVARSTNAKYLAGIWETGLIEGLMWSRKSRDQQLRQPGAFSAPSWSWASIVGPIRFLMYTWSDRAQWKARYSDFEPLAEYRDCHIAPKSMEDGFGRLDGGRLTLRAPLLAVTALRPRQEDPVDTSQWANMVPDRSPVTDKVLHLRHGGKTTMWIEGGFDTPVDVDIPLSQIFVVFLARLPSVGSTDKVSGHYRFLEHRFGLIVQRTDSGEFRRIGFVDGFILRQRLFGLPTALGGNHEFKNVSYVCDSSPEDDDGGPENKRAPDRLKLGAEELTLI